MTQTPETESIADIITAAVDDRGWGASSHLADAVGVRQPTVTKWMKGEVTPRPEKWPLIEMHLGLKRGVLKKAFDTQRSKEDEIEALRAEIKALHKRIDALVEANEVERS